MLTKKKKKGLLLAIVPFSLSIVWGIPKHSIASTLLSSSSSSSLIVVAAGVESNPSFVGSAAAAAAAAADSDHWQQKGSNRRRRRRMHLVVATRLHLGKATVPPTDLQSKLSTFCQFCESLVQQIQQPQQQDPAEAASARQLWTDVTAVVAVDAQERIAGYDLVEAVQEAVLSPNNKTATRTIRVCVLPVQPWGMFVPALNALVGWAANADADHILFCSAETTASKEAIAMLQSKLDDATLVVGAALPGHDYQNSAQTTSQQQSIVCALTGTTSPWNTLALWNVPKLALSGFQLVSEGHNHSDPAAIAGIEEVAAICVLQRLLGLECAKAKLVQLDDSSSGISWEQHFDDPARQRWHEEKMRSKVDRAAKQMELLGLQGTVYHC
jgi:hypothetical protein